MCVRFRIKAGMNTEVQNSVLRKIRLAIHSLEQADLMLRLGLPLEARLSLGWSKDTILEADQALYLAETEPQLAGRAGLDSSLAGAGPAGSPALSASLTQKDPQ